MSLFEIIMLLCFGAAWPFSIYRSWTSRKTSGKSVFFLYIILLGYASGIVNKILYDMDAVVYLYAFNSVMVTIDLLLYYRNRALETRVAS